MAGKRIKMSVQERAKQFMPFASLRGYDGILRAKEEIFCEKKELTEEDIQVLNEKTSKIKKGDLVRVKYYLCKGYTEIEGLVSGVDLVLRTLSVVKTKIPFEDILQIEFTE